MKGLEKVLFYMLMICTLSTMCYGWYLEYVYWNVPMTRWEHMTLYWDNGLYWGFIPTLIVYIILKLKYRW